MVIKYSCKFVKFVVPTILIPAIGRTFFVLFGAFVV